MKGSFFQPNFSNTIRWVIATILGTFYAHTPHLKIWHFLGCTPYFQPTEALKLAWRMAWHQWTSRGQCHTAILLIRSIWRICNGLEVTDMVSWPQMGSVLVQQICWWVPNFQPTESLKLLWPGTNEQAGASTTLQHHLSDSYGRYAMVWRWLIWFHDLLWLCISNCGPDLEGQIRASRPILLSFLCS